MADLTGRIAVMTAPGELQMQDYPVAPPGPGMVLVRVRRTNVCGSELHIWCGHHPSKKRGGLGHEMISEIVALGDGIATDNAGTPVAVGDRVVATYFIACRHCRLCQAGQFNLCEHGYSFWSRQPEEAPHFHATFATHSYIQPGQYFYKVPAVISDKAASSANCALSQVYYALDQAELLTGETVVIQGAGGLGLYSAALARARGARVIVIDAVPARLDQARRFGAHETLCMADLTSPEARAERVRALTGGLGADLVVEVAGVPAALGEALELVRMGGRVVTMGNVSPGTTLEIDPGMLTRRCIRIIPVLRYQPWYLKRSLDFLAANAAVFPFDEMIDADFTLDEVPDALARSADRTVTRASIVID